MLEMRVELISARAEGEDCDQLQLQLHHHDREQNSFIMKFAVMKIWIVDLYYRQGVYECSVDEGKQSCLSDRITVDRGNGLDFFFRS